MERTQTNLSLRIPEEQIVAALMRHSEIFEFDGFLRNVFRRQKTRKIFCETIFGVIGIPVYKKCPQMIIHWYTPILPRSHCEGKGERCNIALCDCVSRILHYLH